MVGSLEILEKVSEGAAGIVDFIYDAIVFGGVGFPFGSECEVVFHSFVAEVEMVISEG